VVEAEYSIFRHTDVVADAHHLPFRDACFDAVVTFNTFEHLHNPFQAAAEVYRVLKPGGRLMLQTAFLQPLHEPPYHFYNATEFGVRRWFEQFEITDLHVAGNFNPAFVLAWISNDVLAAVEYHLGADARRQLEGSSLGSWAAGWTDPAKRSGPLWELLFRLPELAQRSCAGGFHLEATRPMSGRAPAPAYRQARPRSWLRRLVGRIARLFRRTPSPA
jgi:SAM-dependent methyltransferase